MARVRKLFASGRADDAETLETIKTTYQKSNYILDPHTAVAVKVAEECRKNNPEGVVVTLATAHPAKFPDVVKKAIGIEPALPPRLADLYQRPEKYDVLPTDLARVQQYVRERVNNV